MTELLPVVPSKIGVVTVTYNSAPVLQDFLTSLAAQTYDNLALYLVDNASTDRSLEIVSTWDSLPTTVIANRENLGVAEGNNQGIRAALADGCECVLLLNNDTVFSSDCVQRLYQALLIHRCEMTTGKMFYFDHPEVFWCAGGRFQRCVPFRIRGDGAGQKDAGQYDLPRQITYSPTCCLLIHRKVFDCIGLMDPAYFVYYDDVDFLYRCLKANLKLFYVPEAKLWHKVNSLTGTDSPFMIRFCTRNRALFITKHFSRAYAAACDAFFLSYFILRKVVGVDTTEMHHLKRSAWVEGRSLALRVQRNSGEEEQVGSR